jgi:hypothetical protein
LARRLALGDCSRPMSIVEAEARPFGHNKSVPLGSPTPAAQHLPPGGNCFGTGNSAQPQQRAQSHSLHHRLGVLLAFVSAFGHGPANCLQSIQRKIVVTIPQDRFSKAGRRGLRSLQGCWRAALSPDCRCARAVGQPGRVRSEMPTGPQRPASGSARSPINQPGAGRFALEAGR